MTAPNELTPYGFLSSTGLAAFAAKTREDWETEQRNAMTSAFTDAQTGFGTIRDWIDTLIGLLTEEAQDILTDLFEFFGDIFDGAGSVVTWLENLGSAALSAALGEFDTFLSGITSRTAWLATFKTLIDGLLGIANFSTWVGVFKKVINTLVSVTSIDAWLVVFKKVIDALVGVTGIDNWLGVFTDVIDFFVTLITSLGSGVFTLIQEIVEFFDGIFDGAGSIGTWLGDLPANLLTVIQTITGQAVTTIEDGITKLTQFTQSLPNIGSLISGLMGGKVNPATGTNTTLPDLIWWASQLLLSTSVIPSFNLSGVIPPELLALIGVGQIGDVNVNLITDAGFGSAAAFQAGVGWSWDSGLNSTGSTGGAAKVLGDGGVKYLFSNLIAVAPAQQLTVSVKARYTKGSSAQANIICGVRTYNGSTVKSTDTVASLAATGTTSVGTTGADAAGFRTIAGNYTVPADTTHARLVLGLTTGPSGTTVWFDEASLTKTSRLAQDLVQGLGSTISALLPANEFEALLDEVADTTGATIQQVRDVINGKLAPGDDLDGAWIKAGDISSQFISELVETWTRLGGSVSGGTGTAPTTVVGAAAEFASLVSNITSLVSLVGANIGDIFRLSQRVGSQDGLISGIDSKLGTYSSANNSQIKTLNDQNIETARQLAALAVRTAALETKTSTTPPVIVPITTPPVVTPTPPTTPTPTPPVLVSATDDFERASLGSNWTLTKSNENGSNVGILNAHDAYMSTPGTSTTTCRIAAIYAGPGNTSSGQYQKIWATLGSKAGIPAVGSPGTNDLIGRAASGTQCIFARIYPSGRVEFGYRQGSWTETIFGTFNTPKALTSATPIEFYVGDKSVNDQTKVYAVIGGNTVGPSYISTAVLANMGRGWGFGMNHGLSDGTFTFGIGTPQSPGVLNFWSAQEQA